MSVINNFIQKNKVVTKYISTYDSLEVVNVRVPHLELNDGFKMSVQAGPSLYSMPRADSDNYLKVEIGFPSVKESLIETFAEGYGYFKEGENDESLWGQSWSYTNTVYPYVPVEVVDNVIEKHGGIKGPVVKVEDVAE